MIFDSFTHINPFSAEDANVTPLLGLNTAIDRLLGKLNDPRIDRIYRAGMDFLNQHDNRLMPDPDAPGARIVQQLVLTANLPFSASKGVEQLIASMDEHGIDQALVSACEPFSSSEHVLDACAPYSPRLVPAVGLRAGRQTPAQTLDSYLKRGARALHVHPVLESLDPRSARFLEVVEAARDRRIPLICRTGVTAYVGKFDGQLAEISNYTEAVRQFPQVTFVMTHSNLARYRAAIAFAKRYENCYLDTAWQTVDSIREMIAALGSRRVLLASGWPVLGDQHRVQLRILDQLGKSGVPADALEDVSGRNAARLYGL